MLIDGTAENLRWDCGSCNVRDICGRKTIVVVHEIEACGKRTS